MPDDGSGKWYPPDRPDTERGGELARPGVAPRRSLAEWQPLQRDAERYREALIVVARALGRAHITQADVREAYDAAMDALFGGQRILTGAGRAEAGQRTRSTGGAVDSVTDPPASFGPCADCDTNALAGAGTCPDHRRGGE